ncbi:MAG: hypothetical protein AAGE96_20320 [Cyanobacteria bacterium P01_G01_bin.19]
MNTSVHIPKELSDRLNTYLKHNKISKNKFIVEAIKQILDEKEDREAWHPDIVNWEGVPDVEFEIELDRDFLLSSREDIL